MCGRYCCYCVDLLKDVFDIKDSEYSKFKKNYNIPPFTNIPVVANDKNNITHLVPMYWQLIPDFSEEFKSSYNMFNSRLDSFEKPYKKRLLMSSRCIIPANNYYEWKTEGHKKIPFLIKKENEDLMFMAGVYSVWKSEKEKKLSCSIITTEAQQSIVCIHHRMPLILGKDYVNNWLDKSINDVPEINKLIESNIHNDLESYQVSNMLNKSSNNNVSLLDKI